LRAQTIGIPYPWTTGERYEIFLLTSTGGTIVHEIPVAVATPSSGIRLLGLMGLLGFYVGVIPVTIGMLWFSFVRRIGRSGLRMLMAITIGLLAFLVWDALSEGLTLGGLGRVPDGLSPAPAVPVGCGGGRCAHC
jgi:hypothetical protein